MLSKKFHAFDKKYFFITSYSSALYLEYECFGSVVCSEYGLLGLVMPLPRYLHDHHPLLRLLYLHQKFSQNQNQPFYLRVVVFKIKVSNSTGSIKGRDIKIFVTLL